MILYNSIFRIEQGAGKEAYVVMQLYEEDQEFIV